MAPTPRRSTQRHVSPFSRHLLASGRARCRLRLRLLAAARRSAEGAGQHRDPVLVRYYANLELPYGTGLDTVPRTWRRLIKKCHPDLYSADEDKKRIATDLVQGLNRAYEELARHLERK